VREVRLKPDEKGHRSLALVKRAEENAFFRIEAEDVRRLEVTIREVDYTKLEQEQQSATQAPAPPAPATAGATKTGPEPKAAAPAPAKTDQPAEDAQVPPKPETKERRLVVARENSGWVIAEPVHAEADKTAAEAMVKAFTDLTYTRKLEVPPQEQSGLQYGVAEPSLIAKCWYGRGGKQTVEVELGRDYGGDQYCVVRGLPSLERSLWLIGSSLKTSLDKKLDDLRSKKVATYESDDINRLLVRRPDGEIECVRAKPKDKKSKDWRLVRPVEDRTDQYAVDGLVNAVRDAEAKDFVDTYTALTPYGLDRPAYEITLFYRDKRKEPLRVAFGKQYTTAQKQPDTTPSYDTEDEQKSETLNLVYCKRVGRDEILGVDRKILETLRKQAKDLRDRDITDLKQGDVEQVTIQPRDGDAVTLTKTGDTWSFAGGAGNADKTKVDDLLFDLGSLSADDFLTKEQTDEFSDQQAGLVRPLVQVTLKLKKRSEDYVIAFGDRPPGRSGLVYCRTSDTPTAVLVDEASANRIPPTKAALQEQPKTEGTGQPQSSGAGGATSIPPATTGTPSLPKGPQ